MEFGLFTDDGCIEGGFYSISDALAGCKKYPGEVIEVLECCPEHPDQSREFCEECNAECED